MRPAAVSEGKTSGGSGEEAWQTARPTWRVRLAAAWLNFFFWLAKHFPDGMERISGGCSRLLWRVTHGLRKRAAYQAGRLLGPGADQSAIHKLGCGIIEQFYLFVCDVARYSEATLEQLHERIESVNGLEHYDQARLRGKGLIVATAHLGSFEVGVADLRKREDRVHILFQSDRLERFDRMRSALHQRLGVREARVEAGWETWIQLRDALGRNEVVLMQADRVMPGQQGVVVPFASGRVYFPLGLIKLARLTGAPILPVYSIRLPNGRIRIEMDAAIQVSEADAVAPGDIPPALLRFAQSLQSRVMRYPEQWLVLHDVWAGPQSAVEHS